MRRKLLVGIGASIAVAGSAIVYLAPPSVSPRAIETSVVRSEPKIETAWQLPVAATYRPGFKWQSNPSLCGPASVANALRSLGEPAESEDDVLAGTGRCLSGFCILGLTLDQLADVARAHTHRKVTVLRDLSAEEFREHLRRSNDPGRRYIINFSRDRIFGAGVGHHSPIVWVARRRDGTSPRSIRIWTERQAYLIWNAVAAPNFRP